MARQVLQRGPALLAAWALAAVVFPVLANGSELQPLSCSTIATAADLLTLGFLWKPVQQQCAPWAAFVGASLLSVPALVLVAAAAARFGAVTVDAAAALYELSRDACIWASSRLGVGQQCRAGLRRMGCGPLATVPVPAHGVRAQDVGGPADGYMDGRSASGSGLSQDREASTEQVLGDRRMALCHVGRGSAGAKRAVIAAFCCLAAAWPVARLLYLPGPLPIGRPLMSVRAAAAGDNPVLSRFMLQPASAWGAPFLGAAAGGLAALRRGTSNRGVGLGVLGRIAAAAALPCLVLLVQADWYELGMLAPSPGTGAGRQRGLRFYWMGLVIAMQRPLLVASCAALLHAWVVVGGAEWLRGLRLSHLSRLDAWSWGLRRAMVLFGCSSKVEPATGTDAFAERKDCADGLSVDGTLRAVARHSQAASITAPLVACLVLQLVGPPWPATPGVLMSEEDDQSTLPRPDTGSCQLQSLHMLALWAATCAGSMLVAVPLQTALNAPLQWTLGRLPWLRMRHVPWLLRSTSSAVRCDLLMGTAAETAALSSSGSSGIGDGATNLVGDLISGRRPASTTARWGPDGDALLRVAEADGSQPIMKGVLLEQLRVHGIDDLQRRRDSNAAQVTGATSTTDELPATGAAAAAIATASARDREHSTVRPFGNRVAEPGTGMPLSEALGDARGTPALMDGPAFAGRCAGLYALAALPNQDAEDIGGRAVAVVLGWQEMVGAEDQQAVEATRVAVQVLEDRLGVAAEQEAAAALEGGAARGGRLRRTRVASDESSESSSESSDPGVSG